MPYSNLSEQHFDGYATIIPVMHNEEGVRGFLDEITQDEQKYANGGIEDLEAEYWAALETNRDHGGSDEVFNGALGVNTEVSANTPEQYMADEHTTRDKLAEDKTRSEQPSSHENDRGDSAGVEPAPTSPDQSVQRQDDANTKTSNLPTDDPLKIPSSVVPDAESSAPTSSTLNSTTSIKEGDTAEKTISEPNSVETTLASIRASTAREHRSIFVGDPSLRHEFFQTLREKGKLDERGGEKTILMSEEAQFELISKIAKNRGLEAREVLQLSIPRDQDSFFRRASTLKVIAVGDGTTVNAKVKEVQTLVDTLNERGFLNERSVKEAQAEQSANKQELNNAQKSDGKGESDEQRKNQSQNHLRIPEHGPLVLKTDISFAKLTNVAWTVVNEHREATKGVGKGQYGRKDGGQSRDKKDTPEAAEKLSNYAKTMPDTLRQLTSSVEGLKAQDGTQQSVGLRTLKSANHLGDFDPKKDAEIAKLPVDARQEFAARLSALVIQGEDKAFVSNKGNEDGSKPAATLRPKLEAMLTTERASDPEFAKKSTEHVQSMVDAGVLTKSQAERVESMLEGRELSADKGEATKPAESTSDRTKPETSVASPLETRADIEKASGTTSESESVQNPDRGNERADSSSMQSERKEPTLGSVDDTPLRPAPGPRTNVEYTAVAPVAGAANDSTSATSTEPQQPKDNPVSLAETKTINDESPHLPQSAQPELQRANEPSLTTTTGNQSLSAEERLHQAIQAGKSGEELKPLVEAALREAEHRGAPPQIQSPTPTEKFAGIEASPVATTNLSEEQRDSTQPKTQQSDKIAVTDAQQANTSALTVKGSSPTSQAAPVIGSNLEAKVPDKTSPGEHTAVQDFAKTQATHEAVNSFLAKTNDPAFHFTTRGKQWNTQTLEATAKLLASLDVKRVEQAVSVEKRMELVTHANLLVDRASRGGIPGFTREQVDQIAPKFAELTRNIPAETFRENLMNAAESKLDRMVGRMQELQLERGTEQSARIHMTEPQRISPGLAVRSLDALDRGTIGAGQNLARDIIGSTRDSNFGRAGKIGRANLRMATRISGAALRGLDVGTRARAVTAMSALANRALQGDLGKVTSEIRQNASHVLGQANEVIRELQQDPQGQRALGQAQREFGEVGSIANRDTKDVSRIGAQQGSDRAQDKAELKDHVKSQRQDTAKSGGTSAGRDMDR